MTGHDGVAGRLDGPAQAVWCAAEESGVLCAVDFALTESVNAAILTLVERGIPGAVACLPVSDLWPQTVPLLHDRLIKAHPALRIGASISLSEAFSPLTAGFRPLNKEKEGFLPNHRDLASAALHLSMEQACFEGEFRAQLRRYMAHADNKPAFITVPTGLLLFAPAARALTGALQHLDLAAVPVICPFLNKPDTMRERLLRRLLWHSRAHEQEPWQRRQALFPPNAERLPQRNSWHQDGRIWSLISPAIEADARLQRLDPEAERRVSHYHWFDEAR